MEFYSAEMLEELIKTVHTLYRGQYMYESLFAGKVTEAYEYYSQKHGDCGIEHYAINSMLCLRTIKDKYIEMYNKLHNYTQVIKSLAKGYLPISLMDTLKITRNFSISKRNAN